MSIRSLVLPIALLLCGAAIVPSLVARSARGDYTSLPPDPGAVFTNLSACTTDLKQAVAVAEAAVGGKAGSITFSAEGPSYTVDVFTASARHRVVVDAGDGRVASQKLIPRFPGRDVSGEWTETASGLKYYDIVVGDGASPATTATIKVHYSGWLVDGTLFDSSVERGQPTEYPLNRFIAGWTEGISSMKVGGVRKLVIPFKLAYGAGGRPGSIPPRATLIFDVELLGIVP